MIKNKFLPLAAAALLTFSAATAATETAPQTEAPAAAAQAVPNFFDPNYWMNSLGTAPTTVSADMKFNAAQPAAWMQFIDPKSHVKTHMAFTNPATYAQFMQPQFYMEFMKPENMAAWMDMNQYQVMWNPQTMAYWMNPASYMHAVDPNMYTAAMNPANYMVYMNPATYAGWTGQTCDQNNPNKTPTWFGYSC